MHKSHALLREKRLLIGLIPEGEKGTRTFSALDPLLFSVGRAGEGWETEKGVGSLCATNAAIAVRLGDRSRMNREVHVRFPEGLAVRFRWATHLS